MQSCGFFFPTQSALFPLHLTGGLTGPALTKWSGGIGMYYVTIPSRLIVAIVCFLVMFIKLVAWVTVKHCCDGLPRSRQIAHRRGTKFRVRKTPSYPSPSVGTRIVRWRHELFKLMDISNQSKSFLHLCNNFCSSYIRHWIAITQRFTN